MKKPAKIQLEAFKKIQSQDPTVQIHWHPDKGTPTRLRGLLAGPQEGDPETIARRFLASQRTLFAMVDPDKDLTLKNIGEDKNQNKHVRFQQTYKGLPVFGGELIVHIDAENSVRGVNGDFTPAVDLPEKPAVSSETALAKALDHESRNKKRPDTKGLLLILVHGEKPRLAWHFTLDGVDKGLGGEDRPAKWEYFVDALTGQIAWRYNNLKFHVVAIGTGTGRYAGAIGALNVVHDHAAAHYHLEDQTPTTGTRITTHDANNGSAPGPISDDPDGNWTSPGQGEEVDCHVYSRQVFDYYFNKFARNSFDNTGGDMHISAHVGSPSWMNNNACWDGSRVQVGDGDGVAFGPFCCLDVVAHEWTHAVTEHTADLIYSNESGALNESMSDVFAALIDGNWLQGEDNWLNTAEAPAGRNLADPTNGGKYDPADPIGSVMKGHQPDHLNDKYTGTSDGGGVHINSGIVNKASYLIAVGGVHRNIKICTGLGGDRLGSLYYQALTNHLTMSADFNAMRNAVLDSLQDLYATNVLYERWRVSIVNAFAAVGLGAAEVCPPVACPVGPIVICPPHPCKLGPCLVAPCKLAPCKISPAICPPSPCKLSPGLPCRIQPDICKLAPIVCKVAPGKICPPQPDICKVAPGKICPPQPMVCKVAPGGGCLPGPDPGPIIRKTKTAKKKIIKKKK